MKKQWNGKDFRLGMLGGGQLGRMFIQEAMNYDVHVHCLDADPEAPCKNLAASFVSGSLTDYDTVLAFGADKDVITIEIEHVNVQALEALEKSGKKVFPQPRVLSIVQDKGLQKEFYKSRNLPTSSFSLVGNKTELLETKPSFPFVLKMRKGGYDGKGVQIIKSEADLENCFDQPCVVETMVPFVKELSVIVARNESGEITAYPTVECEFSPTANLVEFLFSPADISTEIETAAEALAFQVIEELDMVGILAVELFLTESGDLLINEIAPRPHNSGHHTIECNYTSQFEQHLRSVINAPLGSTKMIHPGVMINLLGEEGHTGIASYPELENIMKLPGVAVHLYGKQETKPNRKMGHVTIYGQELNTCKSVGKQVAKQLKVVSQVHAE